jgi:hypothetical protein
VRPFGGVCLASSVVFFAVAQSTATAKYWQVVSSFWARMDPLDYLKAMEDAKSAKDETRGESRPPRR